MKRFLFAGAAVFLLAAAGYGQTDSVSHWKHSLVTGLTVTQVAFSDWAQGGENALAWTAAAEGKSTYDEGSNLWVTSYKVAYGMAKIGSQSTRKTDDKIDFESSYTYKIGTYVNPYVSASMKTQFDVGYVYDAAGNSKSVSKFFDPAYLTQSAGVGYQPMAEVKTRLGAGLREIITSEFTSYADDPSTIQVEKTRVDGGLESTSEGQVQLDDNVLFKSKLELFAPFKHLDQVVVRNDNSLTVKVSKYLVVNLNVQLINERAITPRTQVKETLALGFSYTLF